MKKGYIIFAIAISVVTALAISHIGSKNLPGPLENKELAEKKPVIVKINEKQLQAVVADTSLKRAKGLGGVESLNDDEGMLFLFESDNLTSPFWMKGMKMSIDIIWINDGKIAQIHPSLQAPKIDTPEQDLALFVPNGPYDQVLEVRAGWTEEFEVEAGDDVNFNL